MKQAFEQYLIRRGYSRRTPSGHPSTVYDYIGRIDRVCRWEQCTWEALAARIDAAIADYGPGGSKEALGRRSHDAVISALARFKEFTGDTQAK